MRAIALTFGGRVVVDKESNEKTGWLENLGRWFWRMMRRPTELFGRSPRIFSSIFIILLVINHGFLAGLGEETLGAARSNGFDPGDFDWPTAAWMIGASVTFLLISFQLWLLREKWLSVSASVSKTDGHHPHASLILVLSPLSLKQPEARAFMLETAEQLWAKAKKGKSDKAYIDQLTTMTTWQFGPTQFDLARAFSHNWQQPLRALKWEFEASIKGRNGLREIVMIGTEDSKSDLPDFVKLLKPMLTAWEKFQNKIELRTVESDLVEGDFEQIYRVIRDEIDQAEQRMKNLKFGHSNTRICVDITGGTKEFSAAAAMATLNKRMSFGYVTNGFDKSAGASPPTPLFYDATISGVEFGEE